MWVPGRDRFIEVGRAGGGAPYPARSDPAVTSSQAILAAQVSPAPVARPLWGLPDLNGARLRVSPHDPDFGPGSRTALMVDAAEPARGV